MRCAVRRRALRSGDQTISSLIHNQWRVKDCRQSFKTNPRRRIVAPCCHRCWGGCSRIDRYQICRYVGNHATTPKIPLIPFVCDNYILNTATPFKATTTFETSAEFNCIMPKITSLRTAPPCPSPCHTEHLFGKRHSPSITKMLQGSRVAPQRPQTDVVGLCRDMCRHVH